MSPIRNLVLAVLVMAAVTSPADGAEVDPLVAAGGGVPGVQLDGTCHGEHAIEALGAHFESVAAGHRLTAAQLRKTLRHDHDLHVDPAGRLLYRCGSLAPDELSAAGTEPAAGTELPQDDVPAPLDQTFLLHSKPGATKTIHLDFDGHVTSGTI